VLTDVIEYLICPTCGADLEMNGGAVVCRRNHSFDVARQGYVNLLLGSGGALGDASAMVEAREKFLGGGHFSSLARSVAHEVAGAANHSAGCVVDVGAGTGYYLGAALDSVPGRFGLALDASRYAARRAARCHERAGAIVCDVWATLPVRTDAAAVVVDIFAPRNPVELSRILMPGGRLIVVTPSGDHLRELVTPLNLVTVDELKEQRLAAKLGAHFDLVRRTPIEFPMTLAHDDLESLVAMGPSAWHTDRAEIGRGIAAMPDPYAVTASVALAVYEPR